MYTVCQGDEGEQDTHTICVRRADSRRLERQTASWNVTFAKVPSSAGSCAWH